MKRISTLILGALAMIAVALISAFVTMRLAIHGREAVVPQLTGLTFDEATQRADSKGLHLTLENRFYSSDVPAGRILAQDPAPGSRVRREWPVRITESLGGQQVNIPDLVGESERTATVSIRRLSLELGTVAHLAAAGDPDVVLAQTPPVDSAGVDGPRISVLVSDPPSPADPESQPAFVMPSLLGLTYSAALDRAAAAGLHLVVNPDAPEDPTANSTAASSHPPSASNGSLTPVTNPGTASTASSAGPAPSAPPSTTGTIASQWPLPGRRVVSGDAVHIAMNHPALSTTPSP